MKHEFKVGDHVEWNSEGGRVRGRIQKKVTSTMKFKTYTVHASKEEPQYLIKERQDRAHGDAQRCGFEKTQSKETGQPAL
jgi:hypothetical protein